MLGVPRKTGKPARKKSTHRPGRRGRVQREATLSGVALTAPFETLTRRTETFVWETRALGYRKRSFSVHGAQNKQRHGAKHGAASTTELHHPMGLNPGPSRRVLVRSVASPISGSSTWIDPPAADHNQSTFSGVLRGRRWYLLTRTPERPLETRPYQFLPSVWTDS